MNTDASSFYYNQQGLNSLRTEARHGTDEEATLRKVAEQFESLYLGMVIKSMRDANLGEGLFDSQYTEHFQQMYDKQLSVDLSQSGGLGLADMLVKQLGKQPAARQDPFAQGTQGLPLNTLPTGMPLEMETPQGLPLPQQDLQAFIDLSTAHRVATPIRLPPEASAVASEFNQLPRASAVAPVAAPSTPASTQQGAWESPDEFIADFWPMAQRIGDALGVDPKAIMAQSALETGWGQKLPLKPDGANSYNLFGIKASHGWAGDTVEVKTLEFEGDRFVPQKDQFRAYGSLQQAADDYVDFLRSNPRYETALSHTSDAKRYAQELQNAGYATDPSYADKIIRIMQGKTLNNGVLSLNNQLPLPPTTT